MWRDHPLAVDVALAVAATAFTLVSLLVTQWTNDALDLTGGPSLGWSVVATVALASPVLAQNFQGFGAPSWVSQQDQQTQSKPVKLKTHHQAR